MTPAHDDWSVLPWWRYDTEVPSAERKARDADGREWIVSEPLDEKWAVAHRRYGAIIHDHDRDVTYEATVDKRGQLDYLRVTFSNGRLIDENAMRRVPVATIRRVTLEFGFDHKSFDSEEFPVILPGGLRERPSLEEIASLMDEGYDRPALHAMFSAVNKRTIDGWMVRARRLQKKATDGK